MIAVIFEFTAEPQRRQEYLELAGLGAEVKDFDGFLSIERFQSLTDPDKYPADSLIFHSKAHG